MTHLFWQMPWANGKGYRFYSDTFAELSRLADPEKQVLIYRWDTKLPWKGPV